MILIDYKTKLLKKKLYYYYNINSDYVKKKLTVVLIEIMSDYC